MIKACWDCLAGEQQRQSDDRYRVHMNGASGTSLWQTTNGQNGTMFAVPTLLRQNNSIIIKGNMTDGMLDIGLMPDGSQQNIVCQLNVVYPENGQPHDQLQIINVVNGTYNTFSEKLATDYFPDTTFNVRFTIVSEAIRVSLDGGSHLASIPLHHSVNDIKYVSVRGRVSELTFLFQS